MVEIERASDCATSRKMRAVRQSGTEPEIAVRSALESMGVAFTTNVKGMPGSPDIWIDDGGAPIFVHGCFWHRHAGCTKATTPKTNREYWVKKFEQNKARDARKVQELRDLGHAAVTIWQCETSDRQRLIEILSSRLKIG